MSSPKYKSVKMKQPRFIKPFGGGNWGPEGWFRFKVRYGDNWWNIASKDGWADPWDLIEYNFDTRNPKEVNWYLRNFVGCTETSPDGRNFVFSGHLNPGYIFTVRKLREYQHPPTPIQMPRYEEPDEPPTFRTPGLCFGVGYKVGAFAGVGYDRVEGLMFSDDRSDVYWVSVNTFRLGGGASLGGNAVLMVANGFYSVNDLNYSRVSGVEWGLSLGVQLKGLAATASNFGSIRQLYQAVKAKSVSENLLAEGATAFKLLAQTSSIQPAPDPNVAIIDLPFTGASIDLSLYGTSTTFSVKKIYDGDSVLGD